jgi:hypothetical protein
MLNPQILENAYQDNAQVAAELDSEISGIYAEFHKDVANLIQGGPGTLTRTERQGLTSNLRFLEYVRESYNA